MRFIKTALVIALLQSAHVATSWGEVSSSLIQIRMPDETLIRIPANLTKAEKASFKLYGKSYIARNNKLLVLIKQQEATNAWQTLQKVKEKLSNTDIDAYLQMRDEIIELSTSWNELCYNLLNHESLSPPSFALEPTAQSICNKHFMSSSIMEQNPFRGSVASLLDDLALSYNKTLATIRDGDNRDLEVIHKEYLTKALDNYWETTNQQIIKPLIAIKQKEDDELAIHKYKAVMADIDAKYEREKWASASNLLQQFNHKSNAQGQETQVTPPVIYHSGGNCPTGFHPWADQWGNQICKPL